MIFDSEFSRQEKYRVNSLEQYIYNQLRESPKIRKFISELYRSSHRIIPVTLKNASDVRIYQNNFFGFHDKSPWNQSDQLLLSHRIPFAQDLRFKHSTEMSVGFYNQDDEYCEIDKTTVWNWQQGSNLQWIGDTNTCAYHTFIDGQLITRHYNVDDKTFFDSTIHEAAYSGDANYVVQYNYHRFSQGAEGYGYSNGDEKLSNIPTDVMLSVLSRPDQKTRYEISIEDLNPAPDKTHFHFVSHALFSLDSSKLAFFYRQLWANGYISTDLVIIDLKTMKHDIAPVYDASHMCWTLHGELICFCMYQETPGYYAIRYDEAISVYPIQSDLLIDGHPTWVPNTNSIVTDSYPDKYGIQSLYLLDQKQQKTELLHQARIGAKFRGVNRCDFHPRPNRSGTRVSIDSPYKGRRCQMVLKLDQ